LIPQSKIANPGSKDSDYEKLESDQRAGDELGFSFPLLFALLGNIHKYSHTKLPLRKGVKKTSRPSTDLQISGIAKARGSLDIRSVSSWSKQQSLWLRRSERRPKETPRGDDVESGDWRIPHFADGVTVLRPRWTTWALEFVPSKCPTAARGHLPAIHLESGSCWKLCLECWGFMESQTPKC